MAYYARKEGWELWKSETFTDYGFCLCCKREVAPEEKGYRSASSGEKKNDRSYLCNECAKEWEEVSGPLYKISRFKIE